MPCDDEVKLVPVLGPWISPCHYVLGLGVEENVGHVEAVLTAKPEEMLAILIHHSWSELPELPQAQQPVAL